MSHVRYLRGRRGAFATGRMQLAGEIADALRSAVAAERDKFSEIMEQSRGRGGIGFDPDLAAETDTAAARLAGFTAAVDLAHGLLGDDLPPEGSWPLLDVVPAEHIEIGDLLVLDDCTVEVVDRSGPDEYGGCNLEVVERGAGGELVTAWMRWHRTTTLTRFAGGPGFSPTLARTDSEAVSA